MSHVSIHMSAPACPLLQVTADAAAADNGREIRLSNLDNGLLPESRPPSTAIVRAIAPHRRSIGTALVFVACGGMAFWSFGRPVFGPASPRDAEPVTEATGLGRRIINWFWIDQVMRKSYG